MAEALVEKVRRLCPYPNEEGVKILINSPSLCGKTSLLFNIAYEIAENGGTPLFVCNKTKLDQRLPQMLLGRGMRADLQNDGTRWAPEILSNILIKYITSLSELKALLAGLQSFNPRPTALLVDDLSTIVDPLHTTARNDQKLLETVCTVVALMDDSARFLLNKNKKMPVDRRVNGREGVNDAPFILAIADECLDPQYLHMVSRVMDATVRLDHHVNGGVVVTLQNHNLESASSEFFGIIDPINSGTMLQLR